MERIEFYCFMPPHLRSFVMVVIETSGRPKWSILKILWAMHSLSNYSTLAYGIKIAIGSVQTNEHGCDPVTFYLQKLNFLMSKKYSFLIIFKRSKYLLLKMWILVLAHGSCRNRQQIRWVPQAVVWLYTWDGIGNVDYTHSGHWFEWLLWIFGDALYLQTQVLTESPQVIIYGPLLKGSDDTWSYIFNQYLINLGSSSRFPSAYIKQILFLYFLEKLF